MMTAVGMPPAATGAGTAAGAVPRGEAAGPSAAFGAMLDAAAGAPVPGADVADAAGGVAVATLPVAVAVAGDAVDPGDDPAVDPDPAAQTGTDTDTGAAWDGIPLPFVPVAMPVAQMPPRTAAVSATTTPAAPVPIAAGGGDGGAVVPGLPAAAADGAVTAFASGVAPIGGAMRDVTALLAAQPAPVAMVPFADGAQVASPARAVAAMPPAVQTAGVAETAIRAQAAALAGAAGDEGGAGDDAAVVAPDAGAASVPGLAVSVATAVPSASASPAAAPVLGADAAEALHVAAAQAGQALDGIGRDIAAIGGSDAAPARFRIDPERLGPVLVELAGGADALTVRMTTQAAETRDLIADNQARLVTDARAAGVQIASVQVTDTAMTARRDDAQAGSAQSQPQGAGGQAGQQAGQQPGQQAARQQLPPGWTRAARDTAAALAAAAANELYA